MMISFSFLQKKRYRAALLGLTFLVVLGLAALIDGVFENYDSVSGPQTGIINEQAFPLQEISGMYLFPKKAGQEQKVYLVGDTKASLGISYWNGTKLRNHKVIDFSLAIGRKWGLCKSLKVSGCEDYLKMITSQWEAVTSDKSEKAFLLHEQLGTIFVFDPDSDEIVSLINLDSFTMGADKTRYKSTVSKENAMGEGMILLRNGHILVIKERYKPSVIEFGPPGSEPEGYDKDLWVSDQYEFPITGKQYTMVPLKIWTIPKQHKNCDLSELSPDQSGNLWVLSQQCSWLAGLSDLYVNESEMGFKSFLRLPSKLKKAEAFIIPEPGLFVVAEDKQSMKRPNIYMIRSEEQKPSRSTKEKPVSLVN